MWKTLYREDVRDKVQRWCGGQSLGKGGGQGRADKEEHVERDVQDMDYLKVEDKDQKCVEDKVEIDMKDNKKIEAEDNVQEPRYRAS